MLFHAFPKFTQSAGYREISVCTIFPHFQVIYSGCCTVAALLSALSRVPGPFGLASLSAPASWAVPFLRDVIWNEEAATARAGFQWSLVGHKNRKGSIGVGEQIRRALHKAEFVRTGSNDPPLAW
jgi:hypothetical protein